MKRSFIALFTAAVVVAGTTSCASKLNVTPPNAITDEQVWNLIENGTDAQKTAVINSFAAPMTGYFNNVDRDNVSCTGSADVMHNAIVGFEWGRSLMGNDIASGYDQDSYDLAGCHLYKFDRDFRAKEGNDNYCHWAEYAYAINQANIALSYMTEKEAQTANNFKIGRASALLVRAYSYMCMMEEYQDAYLLGGKDKLGLPIYTEYNPLQATVARSTSVQTWDFIIKDIKDAVAYLDAALDEDKKYTAGRNNSEDIDLGVANFILARAALLTGDWDTCVNACKAIIGSNKYDFITAENYGATNTGAWSPTTEIKLDPSTNAFTCINVNPETILGYRIGSSYYQNAGNFFSLASAVGTYAQLKSIARIDDRLYKKIKANDFRLNTFREEEVGSYKYANGNEGFIPSYTAFKFSSTDGLNNDGVALGSGKAADISKCDYTKFRLSEVYLMLAEALCMKGGASVTEATGYMDTFLSKRAVAGTTLKTSDYGTDVLEVVKLNWRIEMWGESGREYYNNKRWGVNVDRNGSAVHPVITTWPANKMTLHIPERELEDNNQCEDNTIN